MAIVPDFYWKQHDTAPVIQSTLKDATGAVINLTGATVKFIMTAVVGGTPQIDSAGTIVGSPVNGIVQYQPVAGDTSVAGPFLAEFEVTYASGNIQTFPDPGYLNILITADLEAA